MKKLYVLVGVIAFLVSLITIAPAQDVYGWMSGEIPPGVHVYQVSGTLLHGNAGLVRLNKNIEVRGVHWDMNPWALLTGTLSMDVTGRLAGGQTSAHASIGPGGGVTLHNVVSTATIDGLKPVLNVGFLPVRGQIGMRLRKATIENGRIDSLEGFLKLGGLEWTLTQPAVQLGAYRADIGTNDDGITAILKNTQAPVELTGRVVLRPKGVWQARVKLRPDPDAKPEVKELLGNIGRKNTQGWYRVRQQGHI